MSGILYDLAFYVLAIGILGGGLAVVMQRNVVRAALALILTFFLVAWLYLMLAADLLWVAQLLIYAGAIPVLIVFAIMFTRRSMSDTSNADTGNRTWAALIASGMFALLIVVLLSTHWHRGIYYDLPGGTTAVIGEQLVRTYAVPFEVVSVLLLGALVGAVVLARREDDN
ncbi:MAG: NADH-quinone oxidoreductase subunit J family protein [Candidatus Dormibacteria bacterium]